MESDVRRLRQPDGAQVVTLCFAVIEMHILSYLSRFRSRTYRRHTSTMILHVLVVAGEALEPW